MNRLNPQMGWSQAPMREWKGQDGASQQLASTNARRLSREKMARRIWAMACQVLMP